MSMPFYVAPEQMMKDKADYARKGIARGRSLVALQCADGILLAAHNPSRTLHKVSEIYDRIAFAGVGRFNEFDQLRQAGVRHADVKGYTYSRDDVDARSLANAYAQTIGQVFTHEMKPLEIEILVAEVGKTSGKDELYHILYDGTVMDELRFSVLGGDADLIAEYVEDVWQPDMTLSSALGLAVDALSGDGDGDDGRLGPDELEVALLDRSAKLRSFRRLTRAELAAHLTNDDAELSSSSPDDKEPDDDARTNAKSTNKSGSSKKTAKSANENKLDENDAAEPGEKPTASDQ